MQPAIVTSTVTVSASPDELLLGDAPAERTITSTVTVSASPTPSASVGDPTTPSADVERVIRSRGTVICTMFEVQGMNQKR